MFIISILIVLVLFLNIVGIIYIKQVLGLTGKVFAFYILALFVLKIFIQIIVLVDIYQKVIGTNHCIGFVSPESQGFDF